MYQSELLLSSDRKNGKRYKWRVIGSNSAGEGSLERSGIGGGHCIIFTSKSWKKSRVPRPFSSGAIRPANNFNFHARFAGCGPIVAFPPRIERCFRVKKWPRISRRKGKWREKGKLFRYSFFLFVFVLYSYFYSNFQCDFILSINFVRFLMSFFKSDRGFCERILEK